MKPLCLKSGEPGFAALSVQLNYANNSRNSRRVLESRECFGELANFCGHGSSKKKGRLNVGRARVHEPTLVTVLFRRLVMALSLIMTEKDESPGEKLHHIRQEVELLLDFCQRYLF